MTFDTSTLKNVVDVTSVTALLGYFVQALPTIAVAFTVIWSIFRVLEMNVTHALAYRLFGWRMNDWFLIPSNTSVELPPEEKEKEKENG